MAHITVSQHIADEFEKLKKELHDLSPEQEITDEQIMEAMIWWFFDSLDHMKKNHHHHKDHECCGEHDDCDGDTCSCK